MDRAENDASKDSFTFGCVFVVTITFFTEPLLNNDRGVHIETHKVLEGIYEVCR
jgi:hypothetical protein